MYLLEISYKNSVWWMRGRQTERTKLVDQSFFFSFGWGVNKNINEKRIKANTFIVQTNERLYGTRSLLVLECAYKCITSISYLFIKQRTCGDK